MSSDSTKPRKKVIGDKRKDEILIFVKEYIAENGYSPSVREICKGVGLSSTSSVHRYLREMMEDGQIANKKNKPRTIMPEKSAGEAWMPILKDISSGAINLSPDNIYGFAVMPAYSFDGKDVCGIQIGDDDPFKKEYQQGDVVFFHISNEEDGQMAYFDPADAEIAGVFRPAKQTEVP